MPRDPDYEFISFTAKERNRLWRTLEKHKAYKNRIFLGSGRREQCILMESILIRNPYHGEGGKGPEVLRARQVVFIHERHHLPNNEGIEDRAYHIELSHVCHRSDCINVRGRHIKAEERWWNMWRKWCHQLLLLRFKWALDDENQKKEKSQRSLRSHMNSTTAKCIELDNSECDCFPHCFKHFESDSE